jgi:hypothetical protein
MKKLLCVLMFLPLFTMGQMSKEELPDNLYGVNLHLEYTNLKQKPNKQIDVHSGYALMVAGGMFTCKWKISTKTNIQTTSTFTSCYNRC